MARVTTTKKILMLVNIVALIGLSGSTAYLFTKNQDLNEQIGLTNEEQNKRLVSEINEVYDLPDEDPVVAKVTDAEEFKKQYAVFDNAQVGDYLLFFRKARLNVLYRQSERKVVKTADVVVPITVELVGSEAAMASTEAALKDFGNQITIVKTKTDGITQSFVFDEDQDQKEEADSIAKQLSINVGTTLPAGFTPSELTEIVIAVSGESGATPVTESSENTEPATEQLP